MALGYSIAFGEGGAWFGSFEHLGLRGVEGVEDGLAIPAILFAMFQMTFAIITPALISGAVVERMRLQCIRLVHHALVHRLLRPALPLGLGWRLDWRVGCS